MLQYGYRILSIPQHPTADILTAGDHLPAHLASRYKLPSLTSLKLALNSAPYPIQPPPPIPLSERYPTTSIPAFCSLAQHQKIYDNTYRMTKHCSINCAQVNTKTTNKYSQMAHRRQMEMGAPVWYTTFTLVSKLPKTTTVFTTELYAIYSVIKYVTNKPGSYVLFSFYSPTPSVQYTHFNPSTPQPTILRHGSALLLSTLTLVNILIEWVPGHTGIPGNELADYLARSSSTFIYHQFYPPFFFLGTPLHPSPLSCRVDPGVAADSPHCHQLQARVGGTSIRQFTTPPTSTSDTPSSSHLKTLT